MRRWFEFGVVGQTVVYNAPGKNPGDRIYVSMPHKAEIYSLLQMAGINSFLGIGPGGNTLVQCVRQGNPDAPAADCTAPHFPPGYEPIGGLSPLAVFLFDGFVTKDFGSTNPCYAITNERPLDSSGLPNG